MISRYPSPILVFLRTPLHPPHFAVFLHSPSFQYNPPGPPSDSLGNFFIGHFSRAHFPHWFNKAVAFVPPWHRLTPFASGPAFFFSMENLKPVSCGFSDPPQLFVWCVAPGPPEKPEANITHLIVPFFSKRFFPCRFSHGPRLFQFSPAF